MYCAGLVPAIGCRDFGYRFEMREPNPVFPLHAIPERPAPRFFEVAPFITEVFDGEVTSMPRPRTSVEAAKLLRPEFNLDTHTNYTATTVAVSADDAPAPSLGR